MDEPDEYFDEGAELADLEELEMQLAEAADHDVRVALDCG